MTNAFFEKVYQVTKKIPCGQVATYGQIAKMLGQPGAARVIGLALHRNPYAPIVPCHRVIAANGYLCGFTNGLRAKKELLQKEGVKVRKDKVDLAKYLWKGFIF